MATDRSERERAVWQLLNSQIVIWRNRVLALVVEFVPTYLRSGGT